MRAGTGLALLAFIVLVAAFGWQVFGWLALFVVALLLVGAAIAAAAVWKVRQGVRQALRNLEQAMPPPHPADPARPSEAIDVEGHVVRKPRDGADDPDHLDPSGDDWRRRTFPR